MYEGGIRVPGVIEWPARIRKPRVSKANAVTSDMLPTICAITGQPHPARPLDGIDIQSQFAGELSKRPSPIFFWSYQSRNASLETPYITSELQQGTTPLVKLMNGVPTRNFRNFHHPDLLATDYFGPRVMLDNEFKLVIHKYDASDVELFNLRDDPAEKKNLAKTNLDQVQQMKGTLRKWQKSVLTSLTGADYE